MHLTWNYKLAFPRVRGPFFVIAGLLITIYGLGFIIPLKGPWVDFAASKLLSRQTGFLVHCKKVKILSWSQISFEALSVGAETRPDLFVAGPGQLDFKKSHFIEVDLADLKPSESFYPAGTFSSWPIAQSLGGKFTVNRLRAVFSDIRSEGLIRIRQCESDTLRLKGGLTLKDRQVVRANFYLSLAPSRLNKLPSQIRSRLIAEKGGWAGLHIIFYKNQLTLIGLHGPLFQARWQGVVQGANFH